MKKRRLRLIALPLIVCAAATTTAYFKSKKEQPLGSNPAITSMMIEQGKEWLLDNKTISSMHVSCIYQRDVSKAQKQVDENNDSLYSKLYGESKLTPCILKDNATLADIQATALKSLNLKVDAVVGDIRTGNTNDYAEGGYTVKTVHVMAKKQAAS
ncbi:hypothetical protein [Pseudomonas amygdali]|uniref:Uncharacterized protein n=1 Tax=Pseudomonas amygdali pv. lachrymans str. M301315 TaxID=629260 RepID=A0AAD0PWN6_PSEAV|nr:hypothetical protein [Pseudomonas amygdali]AXH60154.1 hypothetical protein PLA107_033755 [Pseudomonas amygdali pv. lachrymans str. M301315]RMT05924.1 hypothetical protein ALP54_03996 [Pseudomonas amygdali pv. lachrymans]